jgi:hypothetical protein
VSTHQRLTDEPDPEASFVRAGRTVVLAASQANRPNRDSTARGGKDDPRCLTPSPAVTLMPPRRALANGERNVGVSTRVDMPARVRPGLPSAYRGAYPKPTHDPGAS